MGFSRPSVCSTAALNSGAKFGFGIRSYSYPGSCPHRADWEQPPCYPREVVQFTDSMQHNFWAMLASRTYCRFGELIGAWWRLEEVERGLPKIGKLTTLSFRGSCSCNLTRSRTKGVGYPQPSRRVGPRRSPTDQGLLDRGRGGAQATPRNLSEIGSRGCCLQGPNG